MKFFYTEDGLYTIFTAQPENELETEGFRAQGPYPIIQLQNRELKVKYRTIKKLHPDIIAAICITAFYPFIHTTATMPFPVSIKFSSGLKMGILPQHAVIDGIYRATEPIVITNIDPELQSYEKGDNDVIAYGGGVDSTAIACMFPKYDLIHSTREHNPNIRIKPFVEENLKNPIHIIESNCERISSPSGFTTFTNIYISPLILTADLNIRNILCGAILEATCLSNGYKYFPQFDITRRNRWERFYNHIGLYMFSPFSGCSELITSKIVYEHNLHTKVMYCESNQGRPCNKCSKCLRKQLEFFYHGASFDFNTTYNTTRIRNYINNKPVCLPIFIETIKNKSELLPAYLCDPILKKYGHINTEMFTRIYTKSFDYFPIEIKSEIIDQLSMYADQMSNEDEQYVENWDISRRILR